jgi:hypothetical protein
LQILLYTPSSSPRIHIVKAQRLDKNTIKLKNLEGNFSEDRQPEEEMHFPGKNQTQMLRTFFCFPSSFQFFNTSTALATAVAYDTDPNAGSTTC